MVPSHRRAVRVRLLSFRYLFRIGFSTRQYKREPLWFPLIAGRFARGCSPSDIYSGFVSPRDAWWVNGQSHARGDPGQPCRAAALLPIFYSGLVSPCDVLVVGRTKLW